MITENIEDILNSANEAVQLGSYEVAKSLYQKVLFLESGNWEAMVYHTLLSNMDVRYSQCDSAMNSVSSILNVIPRYIQQNETVPEVIRFYCLDFCRLAAKFALNIDRLNIEEFDRLVANRHFRGSLSPVVFTKKTMYPRILKLSEMLYNFGDALELQFGDRINMDVAENVWNVGNKLLDIYLCKVNAIEKMMCKSKISKYKKKIKKYKKEAKQ